MDVRSLGCSAVSQEPVIFLPSYNSFMQFSEGRIDICLWIFMFCDCDERKYIKDIYSMCTNELGSAIILPLHKARRSRHLSFTEFCQAKQMQVVASIIQHKMASHSFSKPWQEQIQFLISLFTFIPSPLLCTDILGILCRGFLIGKVIFPPNETQNTNGTSQICCRGQIMSLLSLIHF